MNKLESASEQQSQRLSSAEAAARSAATNQIATLSEQVKALDGSGVQDRIERMEKDVLSKLDDLQTDSEAMTLKVASLEKDESLLEAERRKAFNKEKALLKRVGECEENLRTYEKSLDQVGRKIDDASINLIKTQLESLTDQVRREGSEMKFLSDSIVALELANAELQKANDRLAAEIARLAARPARTTTKSSPTPTAQPDEDGRPRLSKKKPHKWAGGGADRDIINQGAELTTSTSTDRKPKAHKGPLTSRDVEKPARKNALPKTTASKTAATRTIVTPKASATKPAPSTKIKKPQKALTPIAKYTTAADAGKRIVRAGKGWIEIAEVPTDDEQEASQGSA